MQTPLHTDSIVTQNLCNHGKTITKKSNKRDRVNVSVPPHSAFCFGTIAAQQLLSFLMMQILAYSVWARQRDELPGREGV